jgi:hypothetical protein
MAVTALTLSEGREKPAKNSFFQKGKAPPYGELFLVVIEPAEIVPDFYGLRLSTFYPLQK